MEKIHISDFPSHNVSILISDTLLKKVKKLLKAKYGTTRMCYQKFNNSIPYATFKHILEPGYQCFRRLDIFLILCEDFEIEISELEKNIVAYRTKTGRVIVKQPELPVLVSPIFDMLIAHAIADGNCTRYKGKIPSFNYRQFKDDILKLYIKKAERVFGILEYPEEYFFTAKRVYLPSVLSYVLYSFYSMKPEDFLENNAFLPEKMLSNSNDNLLAVLIAFILDEGTIDSGQVDIGLQNKRLLHDLQHICQKLGYKTTLTENDKRGSLYILADGVKKFWTDYKKLKKKYPEADLDYKEKQIENFIIRKQKKWRTAQQGETQNKIIEILNQSDTSIKELSSILSISRQGIKFHLKQLEKVGLAGRVGKGYANSDIYRLFEYKKLPVKKKGRSRQYGITSEAISYMLKDKKMTTREIADKLNIHIATTMHFLVSMERSGELKRAGKKIQTTHPCILWSLD